MRPLPHIVILCIVILAAVFMAPSATLAQSCCVGATGDVNADGNENLTDLTLLVNFLFVNFVPLPCPEEGNTSGDLAGDLTLTDLTLLVNHLFVTFEPVADCIGGAESDVFIDEYAGGVTYEAFAGSKLDAVQVDPDTTYAGAQGLVVTVPDVGDPSGSYAGGAFTDSTARDLTTYNALTFWIKADQAATLDVAGLGNDNTGTSMYTAQLGAVPVTTDWQKIVIPIPLASKLTSERGMFFFAEGPEGDFGYTIWMDEIQFEDLATITNPRPALPVTTFDLEEGQTAAIGNGSVIFDVDGTDVTVSAMPSYFTLVSSDPSIATVDPDGTVNAISEGTVTISGDLGAVAATGGVTVNVQVAAAEPAGPAPTPTQDPGDVVALYSDAYTAATTIDTWSAVWDDADVEDFLIGSDNTKKYTNLVFAGIEFTTTTVDVSAMTHFRMDVWTPDATDAPATFKVKLVDFGPDGAFDGGDDTEHELTFTETTMNTGEWVSIDVPLASFTNLTTTEHLAQMIISGDPNTVYVDNVYFYDAGIVTEPVVPAPTPTQDPGDVVSLYSDAYTAATTVDTWSAIWDNADVADFSVSGDNMKQYTNLAFAGIEFTTSTLDASAMTHFRMDVWTPDPTAAPAVFNVKLVDFGPDGAFDGGDDVEHELTFDETTMNTGTWVSIDVPLTDFTGLTTTGHLAQMIISGDPNTVFIDNIYFYAAPPTEPVSPAPTPTQAPGDVVSLYSDAYTAATTIDTWSAAWDNADVEDYLIGSDNTKKYTNMVFAGVEFTTTTVDISAMTHFHMDVWTPDPTAAPATFKVKLVDFGPDGAFDGGDDTEHELTFDETTMNTGSWVSIDVPLTSFTGLTTKEHLAQLIMVADPNTLYVDNIYFYDAGLPTTPTTPAPTPTAPSGNVISVYSDAYTDVTVDTWSSMWDDADYTDEMIGSDNVKKYVNLNFAIIEFTTSTIDATAMTHLHIDVWTPDATDAPAVFKVKLVDFGANGVWDGGGDDVEHELTFDETTMNTSDWVSLEPALADFTNLTTKGHLAQLIISGDPNTVYVDNIYLRQ